MIKKAINITSGLILTVIFLTILITPSIYATDAKNETAVKGLTVSPLRNEIEIAPGVSKNGSMTVTNSTNSSMNVSFSAEKFSVINQQYDYAFTAETDMAKWVVFQTPEIELSAGESKKISYSIGVPLSAEPGGRYISMFATTNTESAGGGANSSLQRVASLLYVTVAGDITRSGDLVSLSSPTLISGSSKWGAVVHNTGTTHFRSRYNVQVINILRRSIDASGQGDALILPGSLRQISDNLPLPKLPGIYKAVYTIGLGDTPAKVQSHYVVYITPVWAGLILLLTTGLIFGFIKWRKLRLKSN